MKTIILRYAKFMLVALCLAVTGFLGACSSGGGIVSPEPEAEKEDIELLRYPNVMVLQGNPGKIGPIWPLATNFVPAVYSINANADEVTIDSHYGVVSIPATVPLSKSFTITAKPKLGNTVTATLSVTVKPGTTLTGHANWVNSVAWNSDSTRLASGGGNVIKIWDPNNTDALHTLTGHKSVVRSVAWNPDGTRLASGSDDLTVKIWNLSNPTNVTLLRTFAYPTHSSWIRSVDWNHDGSRLASSGKDGLVKTWDPNNAALLRTLVSEQGIIFTVAWNPAGTLLASDSFKVIKIWNPNTGEILRTLTGHGYFIYSVAWNHNGSRLASGSQDDTIKIWDPNTGNLIRNISYPTKSSWIRSVAWNHNSSRLASGSLDGLVKIWDPNTGEEIYSLAGHSDQIISVAWNHDGTRLASGSRDGTIKIWDVSGL